MLSPEFLQQRLGLLQVGRVKALGEPAIDRCQQLVGFGPLALLLPQASSGSWPPAAPTIWPAGGGQWRGPAGNRLPPAPAGTQTAAAELALEPIQLGLMMRSSMVSSGVQRLVSSAPALPRSVRLPTGLGQQGKNNGRNNSAPVAR